MISLALLGKNIAHSKSPDMYKKLLAKEHNYTLLDCADPSQVPSLEDIFSKHNGLSITSPYKRHFLEQLEMREDIRELNAVNCLRKNRDNVFEGTNTDYLAVESILGDLAKKYGELEVILLGDGAMSFITQKILSKNGIDFKVLSRKKTPDLSKQSLLEASKGKTLLVINSCARAFVFEGKISKNAIFWDYNYDFEPHQQRLPGLCLSYLDGIEMLELQAKFALKFWQLG